MKEEAVMGVTYLFVKTKDMLVRSVRKLVTVKSVQDDLPLTPVLLKVFAQI